MLISLANSVSIYIILFLPNCLLKIKKSGIFEQQIVKIIMNRMDNKYKAVKGYKGKQYISQHICHQKMYSLKFILAKCT